MNISTFFRGGALGAVMLALTAPAMSANDEINYTVSPDPEVSHEMIEGPIVFTFTDFVKVTGQIEDGEDMGCCAHITGDPFFLIGEFDANQVSFTLNETILAKGTYTFTTEDSMIGTMEDGTTVTIPAGLSVKFDVTGTTIEPVEIIPVISPEEGEVEGLQNFSITFDGATTVTVIEDFAPKDAPALYMVDGEGGKVKVVGSYNFTTTGATVSFSLYGADAYSKPGTYQLIVPQQFLFVNGEALEEDLVFDYTIVLPAVEIPYTYTITPAPGSELTELTTFTTVITPDDEGVTVTRRTQGGSYPIMYIQLADGTEDPIAGTINGTDNTVIWAPYYEVTDYGTLRFVIPAQYFILTDAEGNVNYNKEIEATYIYKSSGIDTLLGEDSRADVFTPSGVCIGSSLDAESIKALPSGLYLINGKKIILK